MALLARWPYAIFGSPAAFALLRVMALCAAVLLALWQTHRQRVHEARELSDPVAALAFREGFQLQLGEKAWRQIHLNSPYTNQEHMQSQDKVCTWLDGFAG